MNAQNVETKTVAEVEQETEKGILQTRAETPTTSSKETRT